MRLLFGNMSLIFYTSYLSVQQLRAQSTLSECLPRPSPLPPPVLSQVLTSAVGGTVPMPTVGGRVCPGSHSPVLAINHSMRHEPYRGSCHKTSDYSYIYVYIIPCMPILTLH